MVRFKKKTKREERTRREEKGGGEGEKGGIPLPPYHLKRGGMETMKGKSCLDHPS